ncbi:amino acid adenylation domain-containing protein [Streptomyces sp. NPDC057654]|uniref:non-ribosomal peptide synthetase n=1 Tax=Streptomyces sp. NPDC057654 TaxID=3346196 RepID=UPI0036AB7B72
MELSFSQQRLWFLAQLPGASEAYHMPLALRLRGPLDRAALTRALDALAARHEVLRTRFPAAAGTPFQEVGPADEGFALRAHDLSGLPDAEERLGELAREEAAEPFDLAGAAPARGRLITLGADHHALLLTLHHIVSDGWSMTVLTRELGELYAAFRRGGQDPLPPLPVQYADYAAWQRQGLSEDGPAKAGAYWKSALAAAPALLEVPADRPRPAEQDYRGGSVRLDFGAELTDALKKLGRRNGSTLYMTVLAGWALTLSRLSGQDDVVIGTPVANRRRSELEGLIGFFVNTLALRIDLSGGPAVADLLGRVRTTALAAMDHQDLPFERVVELVNPPRSQAHTPLFQTMFAWQTDEGGAGGDLDLPGVEVSPLESPYEVAKFDLTLTLSEEDGRVTGSLDYADALFDAATAERYGAYLRRVLTQMAEDASRPARAVSLLDERERRQALVDWNGGVRAGAPGGVVERFEEQARTNPGRAALVSADGQLDYGTLERRANRLAHVLIARGVRPGQRVGLHAGRSAGLVVGILGVLKAGAAYVPMDPVLPVERLTAMVADAALVLSDAAEPPAGWSPLTAVEAEGVGEEPPGIVNDPAGLAYVIYTSGSTGRPKGVAATHGNVLNLLDHGLGQFGAEPGEGAALWSSIGFDSSVQETLLPLTTGGTLHLVPEELRGDPGALMDWLRTHQIVQTFLPPAFVKWIDEAPEERLAGLKVRQLLTGVESLPEGALYRMTRLMPELRVLYGYGPTETTVYCTAYVDPTPAARQCPIGRPLANTRVYLLDERLEPVPVGVAGELYVGGAGLTRGYLGRPDLTAERFVPDPFVPGERMYRSGDLARRLPDGDIEFLGRGDRQVKLRGFRIEPGEIEAVLLEQSGVREAAVLADDGPTGEQRLVACVGRGEAEPWSAGEWREALSRRLPGYMLPALFVELPSLPLTVNGKLDREALLARARDGGPVQVNTASPRDHIELSLYQIWQRLLLRSEIGIRDSFFDIGGSSISAIKMAHAVQEEFGENLPLRDIMLHPTIEELGGRLRRGADGRPPSNLIEFRKGSGPNVVCVHPAGGTAFCYLSLAKALGPDCGVYGIQSPGVNPGETFLPTVEAMAASYLRLIEPLPDGPLVISGLSFGGLIAHEMGKQLAEAGRTDFSVVLLDAQGSDDPDNRPGIEHVSMAEFRDKLVRFNGMYPGIDDEQIEQYYRIYCHNRESARHYQPTSTTARLYLMQAVEGAEEDFLADVRAFWRRRAEGDYLVEPMTCDHWELLEDDGIPQVAAVIEAELARITASASRTQPPPERRLDPVPAREN